MNIRCIASFVALLVGAVSLFCFTNPAAAANLYLGRPGKRLSSDSSGTWDNGSAPSNWWNGSDGPWADGDAAVFVRGLARQRQLHRDPGRERRARTESRSTIRATPSCPMPAVFTA